MTTSPARAARGTGLLGRRLAPAAALLLAAGACGAQPDGGGTTAAATGSSGSTRATDESLDEVQGPRLVPTSYDGRFRAVALVLQDRPEEPAVVCLGGSQDSYPPGCGGPAVRDWDWETLPDGSWEEAGGVRWGEYVLVGTYDGAVFTPTEAAVPDDGSVRAERDDLDPFATPCPEPAGGWMPLDPSHTTEQTLGAAFETATATPGHAGGWVDQDLTDAEARRGVNDPLRTVVNLRTTGDRTALEEAVRGVWGGSLCITAAERTLEELRGVQDRLRTPRDGTMAAPPDVVPVPGLLSSGIDNRANQVTATVEVATVEQQAELDDRFGNDVVLLRGVLLPLTAPAP